MTQQIHPTWLMTMTPHTNVDGPNSWSAQATAMAKKGYQVKTFDLLKGWDLTKPSHERNSSTMQHQKSSGLHLHAPNGLPSNDSTSRRRSTESHSKHNKNMREELTSDSAKPFATSNPKKVSRSLRTLANASTEPPCLIRMALSSTSERRPRWSRT